MVPNSLNPHTAYRRLHRAPWLLATSLPHHRGAGDLVQRAYARRMQIEETFRDLKSHRWGFALRYARTTQPQRLEVLLLIATLATFTLWLLGLVAHTRHWVRHLQAQQSVAAPSSPPSSWGASCCIAPAFRSRLPNSPTPLST